jgi:hypothetical protein
VTKLQKAEEEGESGEMGRMKSNTCSGIVQPSSFQLSAKCLIMGQSEEGAEVQGENGETVRQVGRRAIHARHVAG